MKNRKIPKFSPVRLSVMFYRGKKVPVEVSGNIMNIVSPRWSRMVNELLKACKFTLIVMMNDQV
jgi:hypothetical protein